MEISSLKRDLDKLMSFVVKDVAKVRAGGANPLLVADISVNVYGNNMPLDQLGNISAKDASLLIIQIWDSSIVPDVLKAIQEANLGINPIEDNGVIKLPFPPVSTERKKELLKIIKEKVEHGKVSIRQVRKDFLKKIDLQEGISEDKSFKLKEDVQKVIKEYNNKLDNIYKEKKERLLS